MYHLCSPKNEHFPSQEGNFLRDLWLVGPNNQDLNANIV